MANRMVGTVESAESLVALMDRFDVGDRFGGGPGSLPTGIESRWGAPYSGGASQFAAAYRREVGGRTYFLGLIDGPPARASSWEAWRPLELPELTVDVGEDPAVSATRTTAKAEKSRGRMTAAVVVVGLVVAILLSK